MSAVYETVITSAEYISDICEGVVWPAPLEVIARAKTKAEARLGSVAVFDGKCGGVELRDGLYHYTLIFRPTGEKP
jgi:hypothetical protein